MMILTQRGVIVLFTIHWAFGVYIMYPSLANIAGITLLLLVNTHGETSLMLDLQFLS
ncbi:hypothetical protein [Terrihalobacillus insolitus]|uniref:hypothetical protein n=1 Tax=Terrihalobacillus insolitus TaxID=2950438 RepID=UPI002340BC8B|nr:hypothetical protein [Terrihalobacillus insolitus]MDC3414503.1 hypothetical protein [Terrihalobacillus insolitus]